MTLHFISIICRRDAAQWTLCALDGWEGKRHRWT